MSNIWHILLEAKEFYSVVLLGTENVMGEADIINDLVLGALATVFHLALGRVIAQRQRSG